MVECVAWRCKKLAKENKKFIYSALKSGARAREYESALQWLDDAGMMRQVFRVGTPRLPLRSYFDFSAFKLYVHDVGLLGAMSDLSPSIVLEGDSLFTNFKGAMTEQYVLQELLVAGCKPLMGTIVKGQSRAIFPVRFLRSFARQFIVAFPPSRSVFEKSQSCLPLIRNPQPSPRLHRIVRLQGCNL